MTLALHPHQSLSVQSISTRYRSGARRLLFVLPTGGGKPTGAGNL
ncbi:MAG: hypothetical protein VKN56_08605 [Cyanobacteriota bacterium]|nr:hypothetical protein [Cyanobacteriota bacterium]